jgi:4-hydroxy-4-methyl-2-oxoglutarate aldolase
LTPITGKWRMQTVEVNGTVQIRGVQVRPGDLVCADEAGVAFVPFDKAASILDVARTIDAGDTKRKADIDAGVRVSELIAKKYK